MKKDKGRKKINKKIQEKCKGRRGNAEKKLLKGRKKSEGK